MPDAVEEAEKVRAILSRLTEARFELREVSKRQLSGVTWFMRCREITQVNKIPYLNSLWKEDESIWMQSLPVANVSQLIELNYGEEGVIRASDIDYSNLGSTQFNARFGEEYPLVLERIQSLQSISRSVSEARKVDLRIMNDDSEGIAELSFAIRTPEDKMESLETTLKVNVDALKEAYSKAEESS